MDPHRTSSLIDPVRQKTSEEVRLRDPLPFTKNLCTDLCTDAVMLKFDLQMSMVRLVRL